MRAPPQGGGCPPLCGILLSAPYRGCVRKKSLAETNPELAAQIHPDSDVKADEVTAGNNKERLLWLCKRGHSWRTTAEKRSRGSGCPYCAGRVATTGINDLATVNPELAAQVHPDSDIKADEIMPNSGKSPLWLCKFGHSWRDTPAHRSAGRNCPYCSNHRVLPGFNDLATTNPGLAAQIHPDSKIKADEITEKNSHKKLLWLCKRGHSWLTTPSHRLEGDGCPYCSGRKPIVGETDLATTNPELASQIHPDSPIKAHEVMKGSKAKLLWECPLGHSWKATVASRDQGRNCPYCAGKKVLKGFNDLATTHPKLASEISPSSPVQPDEVTAGSNKKAIWKCESGHQWVCGIYRRTSGSGCPECAGSQAERDLAELVKSLLPRNIEILRNDRKVIKPYELDVLIPDLNLAFEFNGTYWHSDEVVRSNKPSFPNSKAFDKFKKTECAKQGINLFFVREKPWTENHDREVKRVEKIVAAALKKAA